MTRIDYHGRTYDDATDFLAELREAVSTGAGPSWLRSDLPLPWALSDWSESLKGTSLEAKLADAALTVLETGTLGQAEAVTGLPFELAPRAVDRVLDVLEREPARLGSDPRAIPSVLWRLLQRGPHSPRLLDALRHEAAKPNADDWTRQIATEYGV